MFIASLSLASLASASIESTNGNSFVAVRNVQDGREFVFCQAGGDCKLLGGRAFNEAELNEYVQAQKWQGRYKLVGRASAAIGGSILGALIDGKIVAALYAGKTVGALIYLPVVGLVAGGYIVYRFGPKVISIIDNQPHFAKSRAVRNRGIEQSIDENELFSTARVLASALEEVSGLPSISWRGQAQPLKP